MGPDADGHDERYTVDMLEYDQLAAGLTYRYSRAKPVYPFGHGLSYTRFAYQNLSVPRKVDAGQTFEVAFTVTNTGKRASDEVAQVYMHSRDSVYGADVARKQLVGFQRIKAIAPGERRRVRITVDPRDMFGWDAVRQRTIVESGQYDLMVGASSADIRLDTIVRIAGESIGNLDLTTRRNAWEYYTRSRGVGTGRYRRPIPFARDGGYHSVYSRRDGDHIGFTKVVRNGVDRIELRVATTTASWADIRQPVIDVHLDRPSGSRIGRVPLTLTSGLQDFTTVSA